MTILIAFETVIEEWWTIITHSISTLNNFVTKFIANKVVTIEIWIFLSIRLPYQRPRFVLLIFWLRIVLTRSKAFTFLKSKTSLITCILLTFKYLIKISWANLEILLVLICSSKFIPKNDNLPFKFFFIVMGLLQFKLQLNTLTIKSKTFIRSLLQGLIKIFFILIFLLNFLGQPHHHRFNFMFQYIISTGKLFTFLYFLLQSLI